MSTIPSNENSNTRKRTRPSQLPHLVAGIAGGLVPVLILQPLDLVKVRLQVRSDISPGFGTARKMFTDTIRNEGWRALYKGLVPSLLGSGTSWGVYFFLYERAKARHSITSFGTGPFSNSISGLEAGVATVLLTNPIWLIKTRLMLQMQGQEQLRVRPSAPVPLLRTLPYSGTVDAFARIVREEGVLALYKGTVPALFLVSHGVIQLVAYEEMKARVNPRDMTPLHFSAMGIAAKIIASTVTYPYQVIKSRLQQRPDGFRPYTGMLSCAVHMARNEGVSGFYRGLTPNLLRVAPSAGITFGTYEGVKKLALPVFQDS